MTSIPRPAFIGGNWKMNLDLASATALARDVAATCGRLPNGTGSLPRVAVFPPLPYLLAVRDAIKSADGGSGRVELGAQNVYFEESGAFTGEVSAAMLKDCGVTVVLVGHSERRHILVESDEVVNKKLHAVLKAGLDVVLCIGETLAQRERGETNAVNERQLRAGLAGVSAEQLGRVTIAYEPVWAIGTGKTATPHDAQDAHAKIRGVLASLFGDKARGVCIQYGGSCKASNARELMAQPDIDGGLIGGASLKADEFVEIIKAAGSTR